MKLFMKMRNQRFLNIRKAITQKIISKSSSRTLLKKSSKDVISVAGEKFISVESLSSTFKSRIEELIKNEEEKELAYEDNDRSSEISFILSFAFSSKVLWKKHKIHFNQPFLSVEEREVYCRTFSFAESVIGLKNEGYKLKEIYNSINILSKYYHKLRFPTGNYDYFTSKVKECESVGIARTILNAKRNEEYLNKTVTKFHKKYLIRLYANPLRYRYRKILELVNREVIKLGCKPISLSSVKKFLAQPYIQNTYKPFRLGRKWAEEKLYPYLLRSKPMKINYKWEIDSTCLNFYVVNSESKIGRRWICLIIDVKSKKILSYTIGLYENIALVEKTLLKAILQYRVLPYELVHDNSSALRSLRIQEIESRMEDLGSYIRLCEPEHPQDKGMVESIIGKLQLQFRSERGYLGDGPRSFKEEGRVDPAVKREYFAGKKAGFWREDEFILMVDRTINNFNNGII